jgi:MtrB/PioB family decaheme-associated outer membrane protein
MQRQVGLVRKCVLNVLLSSVAWAVPGMQALAADQLPVKAPAAVEPIPYWWWHGEVDIGGRFFLNNPQRDGLNFLRQNSLAKFYEYRDLRPGPFGNIWLSTGSRDGLYQVDIGGKNIGYSDQNYNASTGGQHYFNDQSYYLEASKAGQHYFNFIWDQTPHVYSTSALTPYNGIGGNLTLPPGLSTALWNAANVGNYNGPGGVRSIINANLHQTDIGFRRDTASVEYRWTPTDAWDFKTYYSHLDRSGTQAMGVIFNNSSSGIIAQAPAPVNDTTQNFGLNGEYAGTSPWGKKFNIKLAYNGSVYQGNSSFDIDSPFFDPASPSRGNPGLNPVTPFNPCNNTTDCNPAFGRMSLYPDNNANAVSGTMGADLPWQSRYMGTVSYNMMRQNDAYLPFTSNVLLNPPGRALINGQPVTSLAALPYSSLDGQINTLLSNNVVTTQITPELKSKLVYRYYNYDNDSPIQNFPLWVGTDEHIYIPGSAQPKASIPNSYTKQNGLAELIWTPLRGLTLGAQYGYERYNWSWNDADHTSQNLGKLYGVYKLNSWLTARGSWEFSERRYGTYTNSLQSSLNGNWNPQYRNPELANLDQNKGKFQVDVVVIPEVYVSPFGGFRLRDYKTDAYGPAREVGILQDDSWNVGAELTWSPMRGAAFMFSYTYEDAQKHIVGGAGTTGLVNAGSGWDSNLADKSNTFTAAYKQTLIEDKLDLKLSYVYSRANGSWLTNPLFYNGYVPAPNPLNAPNPNYPDTRTTFQRFDALATYKVDPSLVRQMGWSGEALIKLRYAFERNSVNDWQINDMQPYMYLPPCVTGASSIGVCGNNMMLWLAGDNPNYNVHLLAVALALKW